MPDPMHDMYCVIRVFPPGHASLPSRPSVRDADCPPVHRLSVSAILPARLARDASDLPQAPAHGSPEAEDGSEPGITGRLGLEVDQPSRVGRERGADATVAAKARQA